MDPRKMEAGVRMFLEGIGERFAGDDLDATPERVSRAWVDDLVSGYAEDPGDVITWTEAASGSGLVVVRDIGFASVCVHHLLPFSGSAHVAYLPGRRLAGLSKLGRVVDVLSRRLQIQERLTAQIVAAVHDALEPRGVLVALEAEHSCMTLRGVRKEGSRLLTLGASGVYDTDAAARREVLDLLAPGRSGARASRP